MGKRARGQRKADQKLAIPLEGMESWNIRGSATGSEAFIGEECLNISHSVRIRNRVTGANKERHLSAMIRVGAMGPLARKCRRHAWVGSHHSAFAQMLGNGFKWIFGAPPRDQPCRAAGFTLEL